MKLERRTVLRSLLTSFVGLAGFKLASEATELKKEPEIFSIVENEQDEPIFAGSTRFGNLVFIAGTGADAASVHDIRKDTDFVLKKLEGRLLEAGSSMNKVLKVIVYLDDLKDFEGMNEVYRGRFGKKIPVRSTVAVAKGGIPGNSIIEIDCIAYV